MANINLIIRVKPRSGDPTDYSYVRSRTQPGEVIDWLPDGVWPGNLVVESDEYRIIRVTGTQMTPEVADMLISEDLLPEQDIDKEFTARRRLWRVRLSDLPANIRTALRVRKPYSVRGTIYDYSFTYSAVSSYLRRKIEEPRNASNLPSDDGERMGVI